jgi:hypothetical protein
MDNIIDYARSKRVTNRPQVLFRGDCDKDPNTKKCVDSDTDWVAPTRILIIAESRQMEVNSKQLFIGTKY